MHENLVDPAQLLQHLVRDHKVVPDESLRAADWDTLAARHDEAHGDPYETHEPR